MSIFRYLFVRVLIIDVVVVLGSLGSWLMNLDVLDWAGAAALCAAMFVVHVLAWTLHLYTASIPLRGWLTRGSACSDEELLSADATADHLPVKFAVAWSLSWFLFYVGIGGLAWYAFPDVISFGWLELTAMGFQFASVTVAPGVVMYPVLSLLIQDTQIEIAGELGQRHMEARREPAPITRRLIFVALGFMLSSHLWSFAMTRLAMGEVARAAALSASGDIARLAAQRVAAGEPGDEGAAIIMAEALPPGLALAEADGVGELRVQVDKRAEQVWAAAPVGDGRWVLVEQEVVFGQGSYWLGQLVVLFVMLFSALAVVLAATRLVVGPLERLRQSLERVSSVGDLVEIGRIPVVRMDEIGALTCAFNDMLDTFEQLASAARAVAEGDLGVTIEGSGDLQDAFRSMVANLAELVMQIRTAALEVAAAASEIHASTVEHERASGQQSEGVREVSAAMQRLAESATSISLVARDVLSNAQLTRTRADEVVDKMSELGDHIARVSELLELIREVADRSDLLALNGSLEATRAGEAGRGFALVANEMRRLAERVTGTVTDVRATLADIGTANGEAVAAVEASRQLADLTTHAAQQIVELTGIQSSQTVTVSAGTLEIADIVTASVAATTQTRAAAGSLRERAGWLEQLIEQFDVDADAEAEANP